MWGGGGGGGGAYIRNNVFDGKWMGLYPGVLKTSGGSFKVGFYSIYNINILIY